MGYTHYLYINREGDQGKWSEAVLAARQIIENSPVPLGDGLGQGDGPLYTDKGIYTNGHAGRAVFGWTGDPSHETLFVPTVLMELEEQRWLGGDVPFEHAHFTCCKTAHKPYDVVVTAVYAALFAMAGPDTVVVRSDGGIADWHAGCRLASDTLGIPVAAPSTISG